MTTTTLHNLNLIGICRRCIHPSPTVCLGIIKMMIQLLWGGRKPTKSKVYNASKASNGTTTLNDNLRKLRTPREVKHKPRALDFGSMKAVEYRNLMLLYWPLLDADLDDHSQEQELLTVFFYLVRAYVLPESELVLNEDTLQPIRSRFYELFERCFTSFNTTYNVHAVSPSGGTTACAQ